MKIGLLHYSAPPVVGGVESVLAHHARLMTQAGHDVVIFAGRGEAFDERIGVRIMPHLSSRDPAVLEIKRHLDEGRCDPAFGHLRDQIQAELLKGLEGFEILIAHNVASLHKNLALTAALYAAYRTAVFPRLILWHHDLAWATGHYRHELHAGYPWDLLRSRWPGAAQVTVSQLRRSQLMQLWGDENALIRVIPNGVDLATFWKLEPESDALVQRLQLTEANPLLLLPVRLTPRKNIELALHVLAELRKDNPAAELLITGPEGAHNPSNAEYKRKLLELRDNLQLNGLAHFLAEVTTSPVPDSVVSDLYRIADALLITSRDEGFGIPIVEAGVNRLPIFCPDIPALRELGDEDVNYFDPAAKPAEIASCLNRRLKDNATSRWSRRARHAYAWEQIYRSQIDPLIRQVAA